MNHYELQSYFSLLCKNYYAAHMNSKRVGAKDKELSIKQDNEKEFWHTREWNQFVEIAAQIVQMQRERCKIIVTSVEEVYALIEYCAREYPAAYNIINLEEVHLIDFPKDVVAAEFFKAYQENNKEEMKKIRIKYLEPES